MSFDGGAAWMDALVPVRPVVDLYFPHQGFAS
jgi:hypothetical protein